MDFTANHLTPILVALITGFLSPLTLQLLTILSRRKKEKKKEDLNQKEYIKNDELILHKLESLKEKYNCDRVWIAEFHNGLKTYSGKSFQKFSVTYETVNQGIAAEAVNTQNIPTSIFSPFFKKLIEDHYYYVNDTKNHKKDNVSLIMQTFWENRGISSFLVLSIKDIQNNFVGFLCLDGVVNRLNLDETEIQKIIISASNLAGYLEA
jgi:hypothetical protein